MLSRVPWVQADTANCSPGDGGENKQGLYALYSYLCLKSAWLNGGIGLISKETASERVDGKRNGNLVKEEGSTCFKS